MAIATFATGFAKRAGFQLELRISPDANSLNDELSLNLFRVCQEAFTNVYRHSEASMVSIAVEAVEATVTLTVADDGVGFDAGSLSQAPTPRVGPAGMRERERVRRLGGEITISGEPSGTRLVASVPMGA